ncbi:MAG: hypothetical protein OEW91_06110 [Acidimicrobiia bacterium]|nr:hypothetical protein [Acidimicrobiia bacterium]
MAKKNGRFIADEIRKPTARVRKTADIVVEVPEAPDQVIVDRMVTAHPIVRSNFEVAIDNEALDAVVQSRYASLTKVHGTLELIRKDLDDFFPDVPQALPATLSGTLLLPDGSPAETVAVEVDRPLYAANENVGIVPWATPRAITDKRGAFSLKLPAVPLPQGGLTLVVRGGDGITNHAIARTDLFDSKLGVVTLDRRIGPLPQSALARLVDIVPVDGEDAESNPEVFAEPEPAIMLGEGDCARSFRAGSGVIDRHRYSLLVRLIDPEVNPKQIVVRPFFNDRYLPMSLERSLNSVHGSLGNGQIAEYLKSIGLFRLVDRVPIERPVDVADFHSDVEAAPTDVPKASTLGLGYVVNMHQTWVPQGLSLGNLLYSLPLAPGEEQNIAVFEQRESMSVRETERLDVTEAQSFDEAVDSSTTSVFDSAFDESINGGSKMNTKSKTGSIGAAAGAAGFFSGVLAAVGIAGSYGSTSSSGNTSSWQNTSRDFVSSAASEFHSRLGRQADLRRSVARTGVRLASSSESASLTTKRIANHNHCHALTVQYWEVLRHYAITTTVDDVQLVAFIPLELIPWLPAGASRTLATGNYNRNQMVARYAMVHHYADVLEGMWRRHPQERYALKLLRQFVADPRAEVESSSGPATRTVTVRTTGTFLPFEDLYVTAVTESGVRIGPFRMNPSGGAVPADESLDSRQAILDDLKNRRNAETGTTRQAVFGLPSHIARTDIVRFDLSRRFRSWSTTIDRSFIVDIIDKIQLDALFGSEITNTVSFSAAELEREVGGPLIWDVTANLNDDNDADTSEQYVNAFSTRSAAQLLTDAMPIPASRLEPVLSYNDLLKVEEMFQHVVRNTVAYSKAVWQSITPEERAIMLERYTIGVPVGGVEDESQEVPLLNAVGNQVVGFYGNSMVMPFSIPPDLASKIKTTNRDIQDALLRFHRQGFISPQGGVTLPTRGTLGEAVLGSCNSCEKIDLTRFWNWKDSPVPKIDDRPDLGVFGQATNQLIGQAGAQAPASLATQAAASFHNNLIPASVASPQTSLLEKMVDKLPAGSTVQDITGLVKLAEQVKATETTATTARKEALDTAKGMAEKAMDKLPEVMKAQAGIDEEKQKKEDEEKAKEKAAAEADTKKAAESRATGLKTLTDKATSFISMAGGAGSPADSKSFVESLLTELFGEEPSLSIVEKAGLLDAFTIAQNDTNPVKQGKTAFLEVLGLPTN